MIKSLKYIGFCCTALYLASCTEENSSSAEQRAEAQLTKTQAEETSTEGKRYNWPPVATDLDADPLKENNLVVLDDSIVRGTTLKSSIIKILSRLDPKKIIIVSTAPQIRYPDCYGIDMSEMGKFIVFKAAVNLIEQRGMKNRLTDVYTPALRS